MFQLPGAALNGGLLIRSNCRLPFQRKSAATVCAANFCIHNFFFAFTLGIPKTFCSYQVCSTKLFGIPHSWHPPYGIHTNLLNQKILLVSTNSQKVSQVPQFGLNRLILPHSNCKSWIRKFCGFKIDPAALSLLSLPRHLAECCPITYFHLSFVC